jgi:hypothetical protein
MTITTSRTMRTQIRLRRDTMGMTMIAPIARAAFFEAKATNRNESASSPITTIAKMYTIRTARGMTRDANFVSNRERKNPRSE